MKNHGITLLVGFCAILIASAFASIGFAQVSVRSTTTQSRTATQRTVQPAARPAARQTVTHSRGYYYQRYYTNGCPCIRRVYSGTVQVVQPAQPVVSETSVKEQVTTLTEIRIIREPESKPAEPAKKSEPKKPVVSSKIVVMGEYRDLLRLLIETEGIEESETKLAASIKSKIAGSIENKVAAVFTRGDADLRLTVNPTLHQIDQAGEYFKINCDTEIELRDASSDRIFGTTEIQVVGARTLGEEAAIAKLTTPTAKESAVWCNAMLKKIAEDELDVVVLKIQLPSDPKKTYSDKEDNASIKNISDKLEKLNGLVRHDFVGYDSETRTSEFRVVYFKDSHPAGIANSVGTLLDESTQLK